MKNSLLKLIVLLSPLSASAQPTITHAEEYAKGMILKFRYTSVSDPGAAGANQVWDFSGAVPFADSLVQTVIANPIAASNPFPSADLLVIGSDSINQYLKKSNSATNMLGSTSYNMISYDSLLLGVRPLTYTTNVSDSFTVSYTNAWATNGMGKVTIAADGYGTLKLPGATYQNVLRVKITQFETDSVMSGPPDSAVYNKTSYVWYDNNHAAPLMRYDEIYTTLAIQPHGIVIVKYLVQEYMLAVGETGTTTPMFNAFFTGNILQVQGLEVGKQYEIGIYNMAGQRIRQSSFLHGGSTYRLDTGTDLAVGQYIITIGQVQSGKAQNMKIVKS